MNPQTANKRLFSNIPQEDSFELFHQGEADSKKVVELLKYKKNDIENATNIPAKSIRYDEKMPAELKERINEWAIALNLVANFFHDPHKAIIWFNTPNPLLGSITPRDMIRIGRFKKLLIFIQTALDENE